MSELLHGPWKGRSGILLSIDIGMMHSGVSFMYLENGSKQTIHPVTKWPGQEGASMESMIPTLAVAFGAEALSPPVEEQATNDGWSLARNFKAHLYPEDVGTQQTPRVSALPFGVSLRQVYSDFMGYLLKHTKSFFEERIIDGAQIWERYETTMELVMSHPNGWDEREWSFLRDAAVRAGYTTSDQAHRNIRFVTELEASAYCCFSHANLTTKPQAGDIFILCDARTTTTSVSLHEVELTSPTLKLSTRDVECFEGGATSVDGLAERYMRQKMTDAGISVEDIKEYTAAGIEDFRKHVKFAFSDEAKEYMIQIANVRLNNPTLSTRRGRMTLPGSIVKSFFADYIDIIQRAINRCATEALADISHLLLVGSFGDSSYLQRVIKESYQPRGYQIVVTANSTSRAIVDGALIWDASMNNGYRLGRSVGIGTPCGSWLEVATKGALVHPGTDLKKSVSLKYSSPNPKFDGFELKFLTYANGTGVTQTKDTKGSLLDGFSKWFTLSADLNALSGALVERLGPNNTVHWRLNFNVCVCFEEAGLGAYLEWEEKGATRNSPVTIRLDYEF